MPKRGGTPGSDHTQGRERSDRYDDHDRDNSGHLLPETEIKAYPEDDFELNKPERSVIGQVGKQAIDFLSMSNPLFTMLNGLTKKFSGYSWGDWASRIYDQAIANGQSDEEALKPVEAETLKELESADPKEFGGQERKDEVIGEFNNIENSSSNTATESTADTTTTDPDPYKYDGTRQLWDKHINEVFDNAYDDYEKQVADLKASTETANQGYQDTLNTLQGNQDAFKNSLDSLGTEARGYNSSYTDTLNQATNKQNTTLDGLIAGLQKNNNMSPVSFNLGNDTVSFIPKANRNTSQQIANYGQNQYDNSTGTANNINTSNQDLLATLAGYGDKTWDSSKSLYDAGNLTTGKIAANDQMLINNGTANQKMRTLLGNLAGLENNMYANDKGIEVDNRRVDVEDEANDATILDWLSVALSGSEALFSKDSDGESWWDSWTG